MGDEEKHEPKRDHEPPAGAETRATWSGRYVPLDYTASARWFVPRKKEKPAAEIFSVSYVAEAGDEERPVTFVFNGGPGASSAYLHMGAVGPKRVDFPPDGALPEMPPRLVQNESSWLAFSDLVFVDPVGTGFSRVIENEKKKGDEARRRKTTTPPIPTSTSGTSATSSRCASSWAAGCRATAGGAHRSSSPARARAAIGSACSCACCRRAPGSG